MYSISLRVDDLVVAVVAGQRRRPVGTNGELPDLELFGGEASRKGWQMAIVIEQPIGAAFVGDVFRAVGKQDVAVDTVPVPVLAAGKLR